jgi:hypothetical protein
VIIPLAQATDPRAIRGWGEIPVAVLAARGLLAHSDVFCLRPAQVQVALRESLDLCALPHLLLG